MERSEMKNLKENERMVLDSSSSTLLWDS